MLVIMLTLAKRRCLKSVVCVACLPQYLRRATAALPVLDLRTLCKRSCKLALLTQFFFVGEGFLAALHDASKRDALLFPLAASGTEDGQDGGPTLQPWHCR